MDKLLLILANNDTPKTIAEIKQVAISFGLRTAQKWNVSSILSQEDRTEDAKRAVRLEEGWVLTSAGRDYLSSKGLLDITATKNITTDLRHHLSNISDADTKVFIEEAVGCLEADLLRAAVVFSWVGAISLLYNHVLQNHLATFNAEAKRRDPKWRNAVTTDDLSRMKEHDFLDVLEAISLLGKNVKQELQNNCLKLRNACGHPNSLQLGQNRVAAHIETLIQNIFAKF